MKKIIIGVVVIVLIVFGGIFVRKVGFGTGNGSEKGNFLSGEKQAVAQQDQEVVIRIDEDKIYVGEEECTDIEDLKDRIVKINSQENVTQYVLDDEYAIKATYDKVIQALSSLEENLGISIEHKE